VNTSLAIEEPFVSSPLPPPSAHRPRRVLLVEDDDDLRRLIAATLRRSGYRVVEARDGVDVFERLTSSIWSARPNFFGAIVSDVHMPGFTGFDILAAIRSSPCDTPVIFITAFGDVASRAAAGTLGAFAYLEKPVDPADLCRAIARAVGDDPPGRR